MALWKNSKSLEDLQKEYEKQYKARDDIKVLYDLVASLTRRVATLEGFRDEINNLDKRNPSMKQGDIVTRTHPASTDVMLLLESRGGWYVLEKGVREPSFCLYEHLVEKSVQ